MPPIRRQIAEHGRLPDDRKRPWGLSFGEDSGEEQRGVAVDQLGRVLSERGYCAVVIDRVPCCFSGQDEVVQPGGEAERRVPGGITDDLSDGSVIGLLSPERGVERRASLGEIGLAQKHLLLFGRHELCGQALTQP